MKKYDVNFKIDKIQELWLTLSDKGFLCFDKITNVSVKSKKKQNNMPFNSRARIETALYRYRRYTNIYEYNSFGN